MGDPTGAMARRLRRILAEEHPDWGVDEVVEAGAGLSCRVFRAGSRELGPLAVRVPHVRWIDSGNNVGLDARDVLRQEAALSEHVRAHGVAAPRVHDLRLGGELDYLATEYLDDDGGDIADQAVGALVMRIHQVPPPDLHLVEQAGLDAPGLVSERLRRRFELTQDLVGGALPAPEWQRVDEVLAWPGERRLLHMDIRRVNLRGRRGRIAGVFDWANAVMGDAALELARIAEFGGLSPAFLDGYDCAPAWDGVPPAVRTVYRLDAAVMLCVVFLYESEDAELARRQVDRVRDLLAEMERGS